MEHDRAVSAAQGHGINALVAAQAHPLNVGGAKTMPPPSSASVSPRFTSSCPAEERNSAAVHVTDERTLPSTDVNDENIDDAYAAFILYANPCYPLDSDTLELKRIFRNPPKSDGKDFSIYRLWELLQKFEHKEIKTWAQLALDLGVEPPSTERGGSTQKVQQYTVRLKVGF